MAIKNPNNPELSNMFHVSIYKEGEENLRPQVFKSIVNKLQEQGFEKAIFNISTEHWADGNGYELFDLKLADTIRFEKTLN